MLKTIFTLLKPRSIKRIFLKLEQFGSDNSRTSEISKIINEKSYKNFLEIGVAYGGNLIPIAKSFPHVKCVGIDPYDYNQYSNQSDEKDGMAKTLVKQQENIYNDVLRKSKIIENFRLLRESSQTASTLFEDNSLDFVFIDANHSYDSVKLDIELWLPKIRTGGCLGGHDYSVVYFGVIQAVNEKIGADNISVRSDDTWFYFKN